MHPEIDTTKAFIDALKNGASFSEETVLSCMAAIAARKDVESNEIKKMWAQYYWNKYQEIGEQTLTSLTNDEIKLRDTLYKHFGK
ncbi:hypothetical protein HNP49_002114 [Pseudomonas fluvialis]|uniref:Uncharacterized protein n=1 Tax=Pseudomonas fluvialis TaxID=1793966 RepID=A0A7X0EUV6_9PSED|nr:hypothetical protein [Pseudomonas fluvialis]MBB6341946.1 hypothetical protein [Pseudomonas fluvialis]